VIYFKNLKLCIQLLTGYCDPPAGVTVADGMNYNAYFAGGAIGMAQVIISAVRLCLT